MARLLVVGPCPSWAMPKERNASAKNLRVWQLLQPLLANGHEILLCITDIGHSEPAIRELPAKLQYEVISTADPGWRRRLNRLCKRYNPDALIAVMWHNSVLSLCLPGEIPLWVDLFGYTLGEAQVALHRRRINRLPLSVMAFNMRILQRCDALSTCSQRQAYAAIGELGMAARLNRHTVGYPLVHTIQPGVAPYPLASGVGNESTKKSRNMSGVEIRLLWIGGYNAWTDVDTLFEGLSLALASCPDLVFLSTGGAVVDSVSYPRLLEKISASPHRNRFHMLGWVSPEELDDQLSKASIGLVIDAEHYETLLGTRTRLVDMMSRGIPIVTTLGCELSYMIRDYKAGVTCPPGNPQALAEAILVLANDPSHRRKLSENAVTLSETRLSAAVATKPLQDWVEKPRVAPDRVRANQATFLNMVYMKMRTQVRLMMWALWGKF